MTETAPAFAYDEVPYPSWSFNHAHPDTMASVAILLGMSPPAVEHCRLLELGCAAGGNLIPMAYSIPRGRFLGIDLSEREVAEGQRNITSLGLRNVELRHMNILDVDAELGQFDYIVAHGVYSWVPPVVQDKILDICRRHLVPDGVAYISYNTLPGWHMLGMVRDMMRYHARDAAGLVGQASRAREMVAFLARFGSREDAHSQFLRTYMRYVNDNMVPRDDAFLVHDELSEFNEPLYFHEFAGRAAGHGLQYLGDTNFQSMLADNLPDELSAALKNMVTSTVELEQYLDFVRNRTFRRSLLCHDHVPLNCSLSVERLRRLHFASLARPDHPLLDLRSEAVEGFSSTDGARMAVDHAVTKAALLHLSEIWPQALPFEDLLMAAYRRLDRAGCGREVARDQATDAQVLAASLLKAYGRCSNLVELHSYAPHFVLDVTERPVASAVARHQIQTGPRVTNLRHERIVLEGMTRGFFGYLDGHHDRADLVRIVDRLEASPEQPGDESADSDRSAKDSASRQHFNAGRELDTRLRQLVRAALLVG